MAYNHVVYNGNTLIDLRDDTIVPEHVLLGDDFHGRDGESSSGTMPNRGAVSGTIASKDGTYTIQAGYHNGSGSVGISNTERQKLVSENIKKGVTLLSVQGSYEGEAQTLQTITKSYTPSASSQSEEITAGTGYDAIEKVTVTVAAIPYVETANAYGTTVTIG